MMVSPRLLRAVESALREPLKRRAKRVCETCAGHYQTHTPSWQDYPRTCPSCAGQAAHRLLHAIFNTEIEAEGPCPLEKGEA